MRAALASLATALGLSICFAVVHPLAAPAQSGGDSVPAAIVDAPESEAASLSPSGLPQRTPVPRTMEAHWPVFVLFAGGWVGIVAYLLFTGRRAGRLTRQLREVEER